MKRLHIAKAAALIALGSLTSAHIQVDTPNGGESFCAGTQVTIQWHILIAHNQNNWDLEYSTTGSAGPWIALATDLPPGSTAVGSIHSYTWTVPDLDSSQMRIRVTMDNTGIDYDDSSDADFSVSGSGSAMAIFRNDLGGSNPTGYAAGPAVLGGTWTASVDNSGSGNTLAGIVGFATPLEFGLPFGVLLTNVADPAGELLGLPAQAGTGLVSFGLGIPSDAGLCGMVVSTQGFGFGGGTITLHNAFDLILGS